MWLFVSGCCCCLCSPDLVVQQAAALSAAGGVVSQATRWPAVYSLCGCRSTMTYKVETVECQFMNEEKKKILCIFSIYFCLSCPPVELERGTHRKQNKGNHCVTNGNLCSRPCDDIIHKLESWRTQEVRSYIVSHLKENREHNIKKREE